jgi:hypothetical protein
MYYHSIAILYAFQVFGKKNRNIARTGRLADVLAQAFWSMPTFGTPQSEFTQCLSPGVRSRSDLLPLKIPGPVLDHQDYGNDVDNKHNQVGPPEIIEDGQEARDCQDPQRNEPGDPAASGKKEEQTQQDGGGTHGQDSHYPPDERVIGDGRMSVQRDNYTQRQPDQGVQDDE